MNDHPPLETWFKSSWSSKADVCVEVCFAADGTVGIRDSKQPGGPELWFPGEAWDLFLAQEIR